MRHFTVRLGARAPAEDLVQEIYLKLSGLELEGPIQNDVAFLYRLGSNLMLDRLRQQRRSAVRDAHWREANTTTLEGEEVAEEPAADEAMAQRERFALMLAAMRSLPQAQRDAFRLHKLEGRSQAETAVALGVSVSSVEKYVRAALRQLVEGLR